MKYAVALAAGFTLSSVTIALAQPVLDHSLGQRPVQGSNGNLSIPMDAGRRVKQNVFFSFRSFDVPNGTTTSFDMGQDQSPTARILARVTGSRAAKIDGSVVSTVPGASLYLISPAGILIGPNGRFSADGSVVLTTANQVTLGNGATFSAQAGPGDDLLTGDSPSRFGFLNSRPSVIQIEGIEQGRPQGLQPALGKNASILGGNVSLVSGRVTTIGGKINVVSVASAGAVTLDPESNTSRPTLSAGTLRGDIEMSRRVDATNPSLDGGSLFAPDGGSIRVIADNLRMSGRSTMNVDVSLAFEGGSIDLDGLGLVHLLGGSRLSAQSGGEANQGGNININASAVRFEEAQGAEAESGIAIYSRNNASAGRITIETGLLDILNGAGIFAQSLGDGAAGDVIVRASDSIVLDSLDNSSETVQGIFSGAGRNFADLGAEVGTGGGGLIDVRGRNITVRNEAEIRGATFGSGRGADVVVIASENLLVDGSGLNGRLRRSFTGIQSRADTGSSGDAGNLEVAADTITLVNAGNLSISTFGSGNGGNLIVRARRLDIDGARNPANPFYGIFARASDTSTGNGGTIDVLVNEALTMTTQAQITSRTESSGNAGTVRVRAGNISLADGSTIESQSTSTGNAGTIIVTAGQVLSMTSDSTLLTSAQSANGGQIFVNTGERVSLDGASISSQTRRDAGGNGGAIELNSGNVLTLARGQITTQAGNAGGNIGISVPILTLDNASSINADATDAAGGNIDIQAQQTLQAPGASITATSTNSVDGEIGIAGEVVDLTGALVQLRTSFADSMRRLQEQCAERFKQLSTFSTRDRGGTSPPPDQVRPAEPTMP